MLTSLWTWRRLFQLRPSGFDEDAGNRQQRVSGAPWYCPGGGRRSPAADRTRVRDQPASPRCEAQTTDFADDLLPSPSSQSKCQAVEAQAKAEELCRSADSDAWPSVDFGSV